MNDLETAERNRLAAGVAAVLVILLLFTGYSHVLVFGVPIVTAAIVVARWYGVDVP